MKRFWFLLLAIAMILVIASPAGAGKPPKTPPAAPVAVALDGDLIWVHEAGDVIWYSVTLENKTSDAIAVTVEYLGETTEPAAILPKASLTFGDLFSYEVTDDDINSCLNDEDFCDLFAEVTVQYPGGEVIAETSTLIDPVAECVFEDDDGNPVVTEAGLCIWKPPAFGEWRLVAVPDPGTRPTKLMMTMRDGVPGNWCTLDDYTGGTVQERWTKTTESIVLDAYLPGGDGVCLLGGRGVCTEPDCYFAVGNPASFYLYTTFDGTITPTTPTEPD